MQNLHEILFRWQKVAFGVRGLRNSFGPIVAKRPTQP